MDPATVAQRHKAFSGKLLNKRIVWFTLFPGSSYIKNHQFIDFSLIENADSVNRVTDVFGLRKFSGLYQATMFQKQTGYNSMLEQIKSP
jgi:hypothetical protein